MSLDFSKDYLHINGSGDSTPQFFKQGFWINRPSSPSPGWQDVTVSGNNYITLPNAKADGLNYLKLYGGCEQTGVLPSGYTQLEYISTGDTAGAFIELDLQPNANSILEARLTTFDTFTQAIVPTASNYGKNLRICKFSASQKVGGSVGTTNYDSSYDGSTPVTIRIDHKKVYANGELIGDGSENELSTSYSEINLFRGKYSTMNYSKKLSMYYAYISIDGINPDFFGIPAKRNSDNVAGFYDIVNNTFHPSGDAQKPFVAGTVVNYPLPYIPYTIKCNNGVLKTRRTSGLPDGYTRVKSLTNNTSGDKTKLDTGISPNDGDIIEMRYTWSTSSNSSNYIFQARRNSSAVIYGIAGSQTGNTIGCGMNGGGATLSNIKRKNGHTYLIRASFIDGVATIYAKDETENIEETATGTYTYGATTATFYVWGNASNTLAYVAPVDYVKVTNGDTTRLHYVAAINTENTPGFYDLVNNQFISTMTSGDVTAGSIATDPAIIYTDGTVETVQSKDANNTVLSTATAENLLALDTYKDVQSAIDGDIKRNVGVKVLDGSETWVQYPDSTTYYSDDAITDNKLSVMANMLLCTHYAPTVGSPMSENTIRFRMDNSLKVLSNRLYIADTINSTLADWIAWLAQQYSAGTPVTVLYPLATEATETVTGQPMRIARGSNTIEITQASIDPLTLEANYKAGVEVTITEVEDANLDNNVTVTIGE